MDFLNFIERAWPRYCSVTPDAAKIHELLSAHGEKHIQNDHVAFRTFDLPGISRLDLGRLFEAGGFKRKEDMDFPEKKLTATYWRHPDPTLPKIFISELRLGEMSGDLQKWIRSLVGPSQVLKKSLSFETLLSPTWDPPSYSDYQKFYAESEYASWTAAFGIQVNHFTVFVNAMKTFSSLSALNDYLVSHDIVLNVAGGVIKGEPSEGLEQSSTIANRIDWRFADGNEYQIMSCYYEFAKRYPLKGNTELFHGFIPKSADKIFESTFEKKR